MRLRRIAVVGGGPGGLYAARLLKLAHPDAEVEVHEQGTPDTTFGFGVGLAAGTQRNLRAADPDSLADILDNALPHDMSLRVGEATVRLPNNNLRAIARTTLLNVLQRHARAAGVQLRFDGRVDAAELDADLVVAADGVSSATREAHGADFGAEVEVGAGLYLWCGTDFALPSALFMPVATDAGTFVTHAYPYALDRSTFLVETDEATWRRAGFDAGTEAVAAGPPDGSDEVSLAALAEAFADPLQGHRLIGNRTRWLRFRTVRCRTWRRGKVVLLGDAAHTAHYSIGSGTKLAMEDAIALVRALEAETNVPAALEHYESERRPAVEHLQSVAVRSQRWWDTFPTRLDLPIHQLLVSYMTRAGKVPLARFAESSPAVVEAALAEYTGAMTTLPGDPADLSAAVLAHPLTLAGTVYTSRAAPMPDSTIEIDFTDADPWGPKADAAVEAALGAVAEGATGVRVVGPAGRADLLTRLDLAERLRGPNAAVAVQGSRADLADLAAGLLAGRTDLIDLLDPRDERLPPFPAEAARRYRAAGLWGERTIAEEFHAVAQAHGERWAVAADEGRMTYAELDRRSDQLAAGLHGLGLRAGNPVLFQVGNRLASILAWYGVLKAGLIPVATLVQHRRHELGQIADRTGAVAHLVQADPEVHFDLQELAVGLQADHPTLRRLLVIGDGRLTGRGAVRLEDLGSGLAPETARSLVANIQDAIDPDDVAVYQLSGGTTGVPKIIPRRHAEYWYNARAYAGRLGWGPDHRVAHLIPIIHNAGIVCGVHAPHSVGAQLILGLPAAERSLPLLVAERVTDILIGHGHFQSLAINGMPELAKSLERAVLSGTKIPSRLFDSVEGRGVWVGQLFGMAEGFFALSCLDDPSEARLTTVGSALSPLDEFRILEPGTEQELPDGVTGELACRGPYTLPGYLDAAEHNRTAFTSDGFYRTGDLASVVTHQNRRCLSIDGRIKDVINRGGEKVNAEEVELLLLRHPGIAQAAVVAMPDPRLGERACAYLVATSTPPTLADVQQHFDTLGVAKFKWPERLEWVAELPRSNVNKVDKRALRELIRVRLETDSPQP